MHIGAIFDMCTKVSQMDQRHVNGGSSLLNLHLPSAFFFSPKSVVHVILHVHL